MKKTYIFSAIMAVIAVFAICAVLLIHEKPQAPAYVTKRDTIKQGQTLNDLFSEYDIPDNEKFQIIKEFNSVYNAKYIKESTDYEIVLTTSGVFNKFSFFPSPDEEYTVRVSTFGPARYSPEVHRYPLEKSIIIATGTVNGSLYEGMIAAGLTPDIVMHFADIFESKIDFFTETMPGDTFRLKVELYKLNGKIIKHGEILSAEYDGKYVKETAFLYEYTKGGRDYFDLSGNSLKRAFLKAPLSYRRISSYFTLKRFHPILKIFRPHLGIDYVAPKGTPVSTIGDGVVVFAGRSGGFGNQVRVRHPNGYESWYAHLSKFSRLGKIGKKVFIGDVVGYVGATGMATGPHLDFRIKKGGTFYNFLKIKLPFQKTISKKKLDNYRAYAKSELDMLNNGILPPVVK